MRPVRTKAAASLFAAIALELGSYYFFVDFINGTREVLLFFGCHGAASGLFAIGGRLLLPEKYRTPRTAVLSLLFSFAFFIPLVGLAGILLSIVVTLISPRISPPRPFAELKTPEYVVSMHGAEPNIRFAGLRQLLLDSDAPSEVRLKALIVLQNMPGRVAGPMLRKLLGDPADDIRLVAYGMLDAQEKRINTAIQTELENLARGADQVLRQQSLRHIAELHWELVYSGLVQGDVRAHAVSESLRHLELAQHNATDDAGMWFLRGRLLMARNDTSAARDAFQLALSCDMPPARVLPYLAEIAFLQRDFPAVRQLLGAVTIQQTTPLIAPVMRFWNGTPAH